MATLFRWYPETIYTGSRDDYGYILRGIIVDHPKLLDGMFVHTSQILSIKPTGSAGPYCVQTCSRTYTLEMRNCQFSKNAPDWPQQWKGTRYSCWLFLRSCRPMTCEDKRSA